MNFYMKGMTSEYSEELTSKINPGSNVCIVGWRPDSHFWPYDLFTDKKCDITLIEIFEPNANAFPTDQYNINVVCDSVEYFDRYFKKEDKHKNILYWGEGPEHLPMEVSKDILKRCKEYFYMIIIHTPDGVYEQGEMYGNIHESHLSAWYESDYAELGFKIDRFDGPADNRDCLIGYFCDKTISKGSVSLITACKNRYQALRISLQSWLMFDEIKEIIIVDWSSDKSLDHLTELDSKIKVISVPNKEHFNQPQPLNLAASLATGDSILKVDVDHMINPYWNFFDLYPIDQTSFVSGKSNYQSPEYIDKNGNAMIDYGSMSIEDIHKYCDQYSPFFKSLIGLLHVKRDNFFRCGGYNENMGEFYGFEDEELQKRLELLGLEHKKLNFDCSLIHIPHPDSKRYENFSGSDESTVEYMKNNLAQHYSGDDLKYQLEYAVAQHHINHNKQNFSDPKEYFVKPKSKWHVKQVTPQNYIATEISEEIKMNKLENFPPVYYVTLDEFKERQTLLESQFAKYGVSPKAVKSKRFSESDDVITGKYVFQLDGQTQGCVVSHLKAIKTWYESNESEYAFFCEDDLSLKTVDYWNFNWEEFIERLPDDCECVQLTCVRSDFDDIKLRDRNWDDWSETAYIMNRDYAKRILDNYCIGDTYHLELKGLDVMPLGENILFTNVGRVYTFPMFVENIDIPTTNLDDRELKDGQKPNHVYSSTYVSQWWETNGKNKTIDELMGTKPMKKHFVIMDEEEIKVSAEKTDLENLLYTYSLNPENPQNNFNLGLWYEKEGHTAPALSYFLRCAERASDNDFAYEALLKCHHCYDRQGTRDGTAISLLQQAMCLLPKRPEAYYLLARFHERRSQWNDAYKYSSLGISLCDFDCTPLTSNIEYPGKYGLIYEKAVSSYWWGKSKECRELFLELKNNHNHEMDEVHRNSVGSNLMNLGCWVEESVKYERSRFDSFKFKFPGLENIDRSNGQALQDMFVLSILNGKENGTYLEIGAQEPFFQNNTALLETNYNWKGVSIEIREDLCKMFAEQRKNKILCQDATKINYKNLLLENFEGNVIDYLQVDCEPSKTTFEILLDIPFDKYKFAVISYEHDYFVDMTETYRTKSRNYLKMMGYELVVANAAQDDKTPFEDWWVHPDLIDEETRNKFRSIQEVTNVGTYFYS
jgi:hypothetical protein